MKRPDIGPFLFNDALNSMKIALENPSTDLQAVFRRGFKTFIKGLAHEVEREQGWAQRTANSETLSLIVSHPIWVPARDIIAALPPGEHATVAQKCMRTLNRIRQKIPPRTPTPMIEASKAIAPDGSVDADALPEREHDPSTTRLHHIAIDIELKQDAERGATSFPAASPHVAGDTGPEDEGAGGTEDQMISDEKVPVTIISSPLVFPTTPPGPLLL